MSIVKVSNIISALGKIPKAIAPQASNRLSGVYKGIEIERIWGSGVGNDNFNVGNFFIDVEDSHLEDAIQDSQQIRTPWRYGRSCCCNRKNHS